MHYAGLRRAMTERQAWTSPVRAPALKFVAHRKQRVSEVVVDLTTRILDIESSFKGYL